MLRDPELGYHEMCLADMTQCREMIQVTDLYYEMKISEKRELKPDEKPRPLGADDLLKHCQDRR
jgi:hypothetical protein